MDKNGEADSLLQSTLQLDPLDWWARHLNGGKLTCDLQTRLDMAHDYARAGVLGGAIEILKNAMKRRTVCLIKVWAHCRLFITHSVGSRKSAVIKKLH